MVIITSINDSELHKFVLFYSLFLENKKIILIDTFIQLLLPEKRKKKDIENPHVLNLLYGNICKY